MDYEAFAKKTALGFFVAGTAVFLIFEIVFTAPVLRLAYNFLVAAVVIHWGCAAVILFALLQGNTSARIAMRAVGILMLNIPVAMVCVYLVTLSLGYVRVTFVNATPNTIAVLRTEGCDAVEIQAMAPGDAETRWLKIPGDCQVHVVYDNAGVTHRELAVPYVAKGDGGKKTYYIGTLEVSKDSPIH